MILCLERAMRTSTGVMLLSAAAAMMTVGCAPKPSGVATVIEDKVYPVTPATVAVKAGIVTGEVTDLKITERIEKGSSRIDSPAKLTGALKLKNGSADQTVRLLTAKVRYIDDQGKPIDLEDSRIEAVIRFTSSTFERLDPGQEATQSVDVNFPTAALQARKLKEIRLELTYLPSPYRQETASLPISIGAQ